MAKAYAIVDPASSGADRHARKMLVALNARAIDCLAALGY
jgi:hypothetical protein